jgi:hypothetical protein
MARGSEALGQGKGGGVGPLPHDVLCFATMRRLPGVATLLGLGALWMSAGQAFAAGRVAALIPQIRPAASPEVRDRFHEAVTRGLQSGADEVVSAAEVRLRLGASEELLNCAGGGSCVARAAQTLRIDRVVSSEIDVSGKDYTIKLRLLDAVGRELAKTDEPCDICTVKEADEAVTRAAAKLAAVARALPGETATPKTEVPPLPPKVEPPPKVETPPSVPVTSAIPETPGTQREKKGFPWRPVAIVSLAVGVAGLAAGIPLLVIDGQPTCGLPNPKTACPEVYNTVGAGATLLTLGVVSLAASVVLFVYDHKARTRSRPAAMVLPTPGGAYLTVGGRF